MRIWVDADACPGVIRDILVRAAERTRIMTVFVANQPVRLPPSKFLSARQVSAGFDVADDEIVRALDAGDLVITNDIPLAAEAIAKGALALNVRGELLNADNIGPRLNMRDFMDTMRASGLQTGGPAALTQSDRRCFADQLDRLLARKPAAS